MLSYKLAILKGRMGYQIAQFPGKMNVWKHSARRAAFRAAKVGSNSKQLLTIKVPGIQVTEDGSRSPVKRCFQRTGCLNGSSLRCMRLNFQIVLVAIPIQRIVEPIHFDILRVLKKSVHFLSEPIQKLNRDSPDFMKISSRKHILCIHNYNS